MSRQVIPEAAVEAAAEAIVVMRQNGQENTQQEYARAALEAAAPHMLAEAGAGALEEAADEVVFWNKAGADDDITQQETIDWLRARAKQMRAK